MAATTVTTTPQRIYKSTAGTASKPDQYAVMLKAGVTGTVYLAPNAATCVVDASVYITEDTAAFSTDLTAGDEIWACASTGTIAIVDNHFGPGA